MKQNDSILRTGMVVTLNDQYNNIFVCKCNAREWLLLNSFKIYLLNILADQHRMDFSIFDEKNLIEESCTSTP